MVKPPKHKDCFVESKAESSRESKHHRHISRRRQGSHKQGSRNGNHSTHRKSHPDPKVSNRGSNHVVFGR
jgi:hypothetical protein